MKLAAAMLGLAGCLADLGPEVGPPIRATCLDDDSDPRTDVRFASEVLTDILRGSGGCMKCHTPDGRTPFGFEVSGLDLTSYTTLIAGGGRSGAAIIVPGKPCESVLLQKLGASPPFGARMPLDGPPFLSTAELQSISDWIAEGANE